MLLLFAIALMVMAPSNRLQAQSDSPTLIKAGVVITMNGEPLSPGQILIENGKIAAVAAEVAAPDSATVIDLGASATVMPGMVDAYSQTGLGTDGTDEITQEITPDFRALDSVDWDQAATKRQLLVGTTTMCVCPGRQAVISGTAAVIKTAAGEGSVLVESGPLLVNLCNDPTARNRSRSRPDGLYIRQPTNRMGVVWMLRKAFDDAKRDVPGAATEIAEALAGQRSMMVFSRKSHDLRTIATLQDEFGYQPIVVGAQEAYLVKDLLLERKYPVVLEPAGTGGIYGDERSELCWNNAGVLAEAGVPVAISGDELLEQARFAVRFGMSREKALAAVTTAGAEILGIEKRVGKIAEGFDADLVALSGDPMEFTTSIRWVMVDGQVFGMDKE